MAPCSIITILLVIAALGIAKPLSTRSTDDAYIRPVVEGLSVAGHIISKTVESVVKEKYSPDTITGAYNLMVYHDLLSKHNDHSNSTILLAVKTVLGEVIKNYRVWISGITNGNCSLESIKEVALLHKMHKSVVIAKSALSGPGISDFDTCRWLKCKIEKRRNVLDYILSHHQCTSLSPNCSTYPA